MERTKFTDIRHGGIRKRTQRIRLLYKRAKYLPLDARRRKISRHRRCIYYSATLPFRRTNGSTDCNRIRSAKQRRKGRIKSPLLATLDILPAIFEKNPARYPIYNRRMSSASAHIARRQTSIAYLQKHYAKDKSCAKNF